MMEYKIVSVRKGRWLSWAKSRDFWKITVLSEDEGFLNFFCTPDEINYNHYPTKVASALQKDLERQIKERSLSPEKLLKHKKFTV